MRKGLTKYGKPLSLESLVTGAVPVILTTGPGPDSAQGTPRLIAFAVPATTRIHIAMLGSEIFLIIPRQTVYICRRDIRHLTLLSFSPLQATRSNNYSLSLVRKKVKQQQRITTLQSPADQHAHDRHQQQLPEVEQYLPTHAWWNGN